jgi:hypothetical protein
VLAAVRAAGRGGVPAYTTAGSPIAIYAVPRHEHVDLVGCDLDNDDEYDVDGLDPTCVLTAS